MTIQYSAAVRNAQLDAWETAIGTAPKLRLYSGSVPASCAAAATGTLLGEITLPSDWMADAAAGSKAGSGLPWSGTGAAGAGAGTNTGYYRIYDSAGTTCHEQGTVTGAGGGGDMVLDNINIAQNQNFGVTAFARTAGNT